MQGRTVYCTKGNTFQALPLSENVFKPLYGVYELDYKQDTLYVCER